ncbi:MAG: fused MFS/spermidine synthase, partial [Chloroflexota bacterium]|nr:fused MFS/spermidine synthase [Chloroflexota bacterium]
MSARLWWSYLVVFVASGCTLIIEIVAGRIVAPYVGVSIYTWTSVIGVVLAGISLGNYCGGLVADRWASRRTLGVVLGLGGLSSLAILPLIALTTNHSYPPHFSLVAKIVVMTAIIFFPPSFILGMVSPVVIKLVLRDLARTGGVVGRIYAFSTLGSIVGTFLTGFVLIASFGTRLIVLGVGLTLLLMALVFGGLAGSRKTAAAIAVGVAIVLVGARNLHALSSGCTRETDYYCIRVESQEIDGRQLQQLILDHLIHSYSDLNDPTYLNYGYERVYAELTDYVARRHADFRALHLGGGGYTMPRYIETVYPRATDDVLEIDPGVTATAYSSMGIRPSPRVRTTNIDARLGVVSLPHDHQYQLIFGDAFNDLSVPYHLTTREFDRQLSQLLAPDGFYLANIIDKLRGGRFLASVVGTLRTVFPYVYVLNDFASWDSAAQNTYVVAASASPIDPQRLAAVRGQGPSGAPTTTLMPADRMAAWLAESHPILLTDD